MNKLVEATLPQSFGGPGGPGFSYVFMCRCQGGKMPLKEVGMQFSQSG